MNSSEVEADVRKLKDTLEKLPGPVINPAFGIVSGLPGVGKSYFSRRLDERVPSVIIESDALRRQLFPFLKYSAQENTR